MKFTLDFGKGEIREYQTQREPADDEVVIIEAKHPRVGEHVRVYFEPADKRQPELKL